MLAEHLLEHVGDTLVSKLNVITTLERHHCAINTILTTTELGKGLVDLPLFFSRVGTSGQNYVGSLLANSIFYSLSMALLIELDLRCHGHELKAVTGIVEQIVSLFTL